MEILPLITQIFLALIVATNTATGDKLFPLALIHVNDFHSRFEETSNTSSTCKDPKYCIGGYARMVTVIKNLKEYYSKQNCNPLYLFAGDLYQGTLWYNILRWSVVSHFVNLYPPDAMTIGNHEFDHGIEGLAPFLKTLKIPVVVANMDATKEIRMQFLYQKSVVLMRDGVKIGIIGVLAQETEYLSKVENLKLYDEVDTIKKEAELLNEQGVKIIIVLSHAGIDMEKRIARDGGPYIDVIVGGHSHTFLYHGKPPTEYGPKIDEYPVIVGQANSNRKVYIVHAGSFTRFVGNFTVFFDSSGEVVGHEGNPVFLANGIVQDKLIADQINIWKGKLGEAGQWVFGETMLTLDRTECDRGECSLGNHIADAYRYAFTSKLKDHEKNTTMVSLLSVGGLRTSMDKGIVKYADILGVLPFENPLRSFDVQGKNLKLALEHSVSEIDQYLDNSRKKKILSVSGLEVWYNFKYPKNQRVINIKIKCRTCPFGSIPFKETDYYRVIMPSFLAEGGDGYSMFIEDSDNNAIIGETDLDAVKNYMQDFSPLNANINHRLVFFNLLRRTS